jgi:uncharacterized membrane protein YdjX (TVP38/TMEM64 family)
VRRFVRVTLILLVVGAVVGAVMASGLMDQVRDEDQLRTTIDDAGVLGPVLFIGLMVLLVPLNVPGVVFVIPATTMFGTPVGVALSLVGGFLASIIGLVAARRLGRKALETRLPARLRKWEQRLTDGGFWAVVVARMFTYLMQPVDWLLGLSGIPMRTILLGTFVGLIPPTLVISLGGGNVFQRVL